MATCGCLPPTRDRLRRAPPSGTKVPAAQQSAPSLQTAPTKGAGRTHRQRHLNGKSATSLLAGATLTCVSRGSVQMQNALRCCVGGAVCQELRLWLIPTRSSHAEVATCNLGLFALTDAPLHPVAEAFTVANRHCRVCFVALSDTTALHVVFQVTPPFATALAAPRDASGRSDVATCRGRAEEGIPV